MTRQRVGTVAGTEEYPATPQGFRFRADGTDGADDGVGIGSVVVVADGDRRIYAVVTDGYQVGEDGGGRIPRLWQAAVLRQIPDEPIRPVPIAPVMLASADELPIALRTDSYADSGVPVGLHLGPDGGARVLLDPDFLLGPEAAHCNVTGVSGLATKTSLLTTLLTGVFQRLPAARGSVAAVCFNVKGPDLLFLDQPAVLGERDLAAWKAMGLAAVPFQDVTVYAPYHADGVNLNTLRTHPGLVSNVEPLSWGLPEVLEFAEVVLNRDDLDAKAEALLDFLADRVVGRVFEAPELRGSPFAVRSFADLDALFRAVFEMLEERGRGAEAWRTHHVATIRKVRNRLGNLAARSRGLITDSGPASDLPWGRFRDRSVTVVDMAGVDPLAQELAFTRIISRLREQLERRELGVDQVIVVVDELNKYAPSDGTDSYVKRMLLDIAERGRYLGLVLFSAQQFRSQVERRVVGNAATAIYGRMDQDELALPGYSVMSPAVRARLAGLPKGEVLVRHPHFTHPVFVKFPRPAVLSGREGIERFPPAAALPFAEAVAGRLRRIGGRVDQAAVKEIVAERTEQEVLAALSRTELERPADVVAYFRACFGRIATVSGRQASPGTAPLAADPGDPFSPY